MTTGCRVLVPLRVALEYVVSPTDPDPRGMEVIGADGAIAGVVVDVWIDRSENSFRYLEMRLAGADRTVIVPLPFCQFTTRRRIRVRALLAAQFAQVPPLRDPDSITLLEEDKVSAYFGGGAMFAVPGRMGPLL